MNSTLSLAISSLETIAGGTRWDLIEEYAVRVISMDPGNVYALKQLSRAYYALKKYDLLKHICEDLISKHPKDPYLYYMLYLYYRQGGQADYSNYLKARDTLRVAISIDPNIAINYRELGEIYLINWEPEKAKIYLETASRLQPTNAEYLARYAIALLRCRNTKEARVAIDIALKMEPENYDVLNSVGQVLLFSGELDEAETFFRETLRLMPTYDYFQTQLKSCLHEKQDRDRRLADGKIYTPLVLRQRGRKKCFDEEDGDRLAPQR